MRYSLLAAICLVGCAVTEQDYPLAWDPLPHRAPESCARFTGSYADKGEAAGPATDRGARDAAQTRTSLVGVLSRPDLDRDRSAARERDETRVDRRRAD